MMLGMFLKATSSMIETVVGPETPEKSLRSAGLEGLNHTVMTVGAV